jgi:hypothetical protein
MEKALGDKYVDPREHKGVQGKASGGKFVSLKKASQMDVPKNMWSLGYLVYAYGVDKATFRRRLKAEKERRIAHGLGYFLSGVLCVSRNAALQSPT